MNRKVYQKKLMCGKHGARFGRRDKLQGKREGEKNE